MNRIAVAAVVVATAAGIMASGWPSCNANWSGVDESVVERFAKQAGHEPSEPFINTEQGDLPLFVFLLAGALGGFLGGYYFRQLFPPRRGAEQNLKPQE